LPRDDMAILYAFCDYGKHCVYAVLNPAVTCITVSYTGRANC